MKRVNAFLWAIFLISGCASFGRQFNYQNIPQLQLGQLKSSEYRVIFGKPQRSNTEKNSDGNFETAAYLFSHSNFLDILSQRQLFLEFKDGLLNAYCYVSSFEPEKRDIKFGEADRIQLNQSTKEDVLRILGEPSGKGSCPTTIFSVKEKCPKNGEIWVWIKENRHSLFDMNTKWDAQITIIFNENAVVSNIITSKCENY